MSSRVDGRNSVRAVGPLLGALQTSGLDRATIATSLGLPVDALDEDGAGLDAEQMRRLWEFGARALGDPRVGFHLGQKVSRDSFDVVSHLASSSATLEEALTRIQRYLRLLTTSVGYDLAVTDEHAVLRMHSVGGVPPIRHADEFSIAARCAYIRQWLGRDFRPHEVFFRHRLEPGEDASEYEAFFGCEVGFGTAACGFSFDPVELRAELPGADPSLGRLLTRYAEEALATMPKVEAYASRVRRALIEGMEVGEVQVAEVAKKLATSERSLQRRLREEGVTFVDLLEEVRRDLAVRYLRQGGLSVSEVAYLLGYSEKATFFRAFRKWTGETPGAFRAKGKRVGRS